MFYTHTLRCMCFCLSLSYPSCIDWALHSQRSSRCVGNVWTWCWTCEHSWMPVGTRSRTPGTPAVAMCTHQSTHPAYRSPSTACRENTWERQRENNLYNHSPFRKYWYSLLLLLFLNFLFFWLNLWSDINMISFYFRIFTLRCVKNNTWYL